MTEIALSALFVLFVALVPIVFVASLFILLVGVPVLSGLTADSLRKWKPRLAGQRTRVTKTHRFRIVWHVPHHR
jgi:hypothetical protein